MSTQNQFDILKPINIQSIQAFRGWIKEKMPHLYPGKEIPEEHLLIFLGYVKNKVEEAREIDRAFWLSLIRGLESKINSIKRVEEKNEL